MFPDIIEHDQRINTKTSFVPSVVYTFAPNAGSYQKHSRGPKSSPSIFQYLEQVLALINLEGRQLFLPAGYPHSVTEDYATFQAWDTLQALCSYLRNVLSTKSVLETVGVGKESATPLAAALQWVLRDGSGMLGGLSFSYVIGPRFDANVKFWRLFADCILDVGLCLDMLAPFFPTWGIEILWMSSLCKAMCGVAAGSTRSALTAHFARHDNMADLAAKEGAQETAVTLVGLSLGMYFASVANSTDVTIWVAFLLLTALHVYANYQAVRCLRIPNLNPSRAHLLIASFRKQLHYASQADKQEKGACPSLDIKTINACESIVSSVFPSTYARIVVGARLSDCNFDSDGKSIGLDMGEIARILRQESYLLVVSSRKHCIHILLHVHCEPLHELRALYHAHLMLDALGWTTSTSSMSSFSTKIHGNVIAWTYRVMKNEFEAFTTALSKHAWKTNRFFFTHSPWRYNWDKAC